jgi:hypothetical protein
VLLATLAACAIVGALAGWQLRDSALHVSPKRGELRAVCLRGFLFADDGRDPPLQFRNSLRGGVPCGDRVGKPCMGSACR